MVNHVHIQSCIYTKSYISPIQNHINQNRIIHYLYTMELYNDNERFISILSDYGFKATFGNESDTTFLKKALQALIKSPVPI
jgi:hypothetical protein